MQCLIYIIPFLNTGIYCCGPVSLLAIKRGEVHLPYDGRFVFAEVNADKVYWVVNEDRSMDVKGIRKDRLDIY